MRFCAPKEKSKAAKGFRFSENRLFSCNVFLGVKDVLSGMVFSMPAEDGRVERLRIDLGDHTAFPVMYSQGGAPTTDAEIALSSLNAVELGKTAKAAFEARNADLMRVVTPMELGDKTAASETALRYQA